MKTFFRERQTWPKTKLQEEILPVAREHASSAFCHAPIFSPKWRIPSARGIIKPFILFTIALNILLITSVQPSFAKGPEFSDFCKTYYNDGQDSQAQSDIKVCQGLSADFSKSLKLYSTKAGFDKWPQTSLSDLAKQNQLIDGQTKLTTLAKFENAFKDEHKDLYSLISGDGDSAKHIPKDSHFGPTLWSYRAVIVLNSDKRNSSIVKVHIQEQTNNHYVFDTKSLTISKGTTVKWINSTDEKHDLATKSHSPSTFDLEVAKKKGTTVSHTFATAGTYHIECTIHPKTMKMTIKVQ